MSETRTAEWMDLPRPGDPRITDIIGAGLAAVGLPGGDTAAKDLLGIASTGSQLLIILVDGLGYHPLVDHFGHAPTLRAMRDSIASIHTIAPSTTAAAITSLGTGCEPGLTRMVGYSVAHGDSVMNLLAFEDGPAPESWQECPTHFERLSAAGVESAVVSPPTFAGSGLTRAALRGARHVGAYSWDQRCSAALAELRAGTRVVYLYWSDIDHEGHGHGVQSPQWADALEEFDRGLGQLLRRLPTDVTTLLTADHGMVDVVGSDLVDVASTPALREGVRIVAGETRAVHVHALPGCADGVIDRWTEFLEDRGAVIPRGELAPFLAKGPGLDAVGDALVFMSGRYGVVDSRTQSDKAIAMPGVHGSLTPEEMRIPLVQLS